jgi:hypothetical protein
MNSEPAREMKVAPVAPPASRRAARVGRTRRILPKLILLCGALVAGLVLGEVATRWLAPQDLSGSWRSEHPRGYFLNKAEGISRHQYGDRVV